MILWHSLRPSKAEVKKKYGIRKLPFTVGTMIEVPRAAITADEIAAIAVFCALDAPESMTGATLDANGASYVR